MRRFSTLVLGGLVLGVLAILDGCGLETVASLNDPPVNYADSVANTDAFVSFVHHDANYDLTVFKGYLLYYKIYAGASSTASARLLADRDTLSTSPTVSRLEATLGYSRFTVSSTQGSTPSIRDDLVLLPSDGQTVKVDFSLLLNDPTSDQLEPILTLGGALTAKPYLYRSRLVPGASFRNLRTATTKDADMDALDGGSNYEVNLFIVAYGFTPNLETVYSKPVPWGVIRTIKP